MSLRRLALAVSTLLLRSSGIFALGRWRRRRRGDYRVFILEYHEISGDGTEPNGVVDATRFRRHVAWLRRLFAHVDTVAGATQRLASGQLDHDVLVITFDDGYVGNFEHAWPDLQHHGMTASFYLATSFIDGRPLWFDVARRALETSLKNDAAVEGRMRQLKRLPDAERRRQVDELASSTAPRRALAQPMRWAQIKALAAEGAEIGGHTVSHPILSTLEPAEQRREIEDGNARLAEKLGSPPRTFAMPNGSAADYDRHTLKLLEASDLDAACTTRRGSNKVGCDLLQLRRLGVGSDSVAMLDARLAGLFDEEVRAWASTWWRGARAR